MAYEIRENSGSLWPNDKREKDSHPNSKGQVKIDGKLYWVSGWTKATDDGRKWLSLSFQAQEDKFAVSTKEPDAVLDDDLDGIPF